MFITDGKAVAAESYRLHAFKHGNTDVVGLNGNSVPGNGERKYNKKYCGI
jgi:hypothetical protein